jgi:hypothetical protein
MIKIDDSKFKSKVVEEILMKKPENAIKLLSDRYSITEPGLNVGIVKGHSVRALAVYVSAKEMIYVRSREFLYDPFVIIHEFYHHLRTHSTQHRGTEKHADLFAKDFLRSYFIEKKKIRNNQN